MGWGAFLKLFAYFFTLLSWPSFTLLYSVYASFLAIESGSSSRNRRCLTYWVLFSLVKVLESSFVNLFEWHPFWSYAKGTATFLLVIPYFGGASYVYKHFISPYISEQKWSILFISRREGFRVTEQDTFLDTTKGNDIKNELEEKEKHIICQGVPDPSYDSTERNVTQPTSPKKVQKQWSCALCLVSTSSEESLNGHLLGKKHKAKQAEVKKFPMKSASKSSTMLKKNSEAVFFQKLNQILMLKSIRLCRWKKPEFGWTKLNTDGSVDRENAGFGGLLRDYKGDPICAFVSKAPGDDIFFVELWAIWRGLVLAANIGIKVIWVESDSMSAVKTINREQPLSPKVAICLMHIWKLLKKFKKYTVSHSWRETNRAADHLAKMAVLGSDVVLWPVDFPRSLCNIIKDDAQGKIYYRM